MEAAQHKSCETVVVANELVAGDWESAPPPKTQPQDLSKGARYEVVVDTIAMRSRPSFDARRRAIKAKGVVVELFQWDPTRTWRRCVDELTWIDGWLPLDHPEQGPLLRPVGVPFEWRPLDPVRVAVRENTPLELRRFLKAGLDPDIRDPKGYTPLMLGAAAGYVECCVLLLLVGRQADPSLKAPDGTTAAEMAPMGPVRALLLALSNRETEADPLELEAMMQKLNRRTYIGGLAAEWIDQMRLATSNGHITKKVDVDLGELAKELRAMAR
eukprot:gnl/TRDRNA2_/TRDRNA2_155088_c0_seq2.p1 gnl/TRDRNA2_/TRDRNA2_155088_c0~~gnl/TRDRNA2_/TRDRNA2_155088_c0_seq2.p1  ORF type:complete len:303 (+),score=50.86 gnl/TRDRNA2_/TRDRNA2_155088_c0_seq2:97-909(+)